MLKNLNRLLLSTLVGALVLATPVGLCILSFRYQQVAAAILWTLLVLIILRLALLVGNLILGYPDKYIED